MANPQLPVTDIRLATSVSHFSLRESDLDLTTFFTSILKPRNTVQQIQRKMQQVFGVVNFSENQERSGQMRWEIDSDIRGEPLQVFASATTRTFSLRRAVRYSDDLISILGYEDQIKNPDHTADGSLLSQSLKDPFIWIKSEIAPAGTGIGTVVTFYRGCVLTSLKRDYHIDGDVGVYEDAVVYYAKRQQFNT